MHLIHELCFFDSWTRHYAIYIDRYQLDLVDLLAACAETPLLEHRPNDTAIHGRTVGYQVKRQGCDEIWNIDPLPMIRIEDDEADGDVTSGRSSNIASNRQQPCSSNNQASEKTCVNEFKTAVETVAAAAHASTQVVLRTLLPRANIEKVLKSQVTPQVVKTPFFNFFLAVYKVESQHQLFELIQHVVLPDIQSMHDHRDRLNQDPHRHQHHSQSSMQEDVCQDGALNTENTPNNSGLSARHSEHHKTVVLQNTSAGNLLLNVLKVQNPTEHLFKVSVPFLCHHASYFLGSEPCAALVEDVVMGLVRCAPLVKQNLKQTRDLINCLSCILKFLNPRSQVRFLRSAVRIIRSDLLSSTSLFLLSVLQFFYREHADYYLGASAFRTTVEAYQHSHHHTDTSMQATAQMSLLNANGEMASDAHFQQEYEYGSAGEDCIEVTMTLFLVLWEGIMECEKDLNKAPINYTSPYKTILLDCLVSVTLALGPTVHTQSIDNKKYWLELDSTQPYDPQPVDTSHTFLSKDLEYLINDLAKQLHEVWAHKKIQQGWLFGPVRDNEKKRHPLLIPYEQLPDKDKEYNREMSREQIKVIVALGWNIKKVDRLVFQRRRTSLLSLVPSSFGDTLAQLDCAMGMYDGISFQEDEELADTSLSDSFEDGLTAKDEVFTLVENQNQDKSNRDELANLRDPVLEFDATKQSASKNYEPTSSRQADLLPDSQNSLKGAHWIPNFQNLASVRLNEDVLAVIEQLAEHSHDVWAVSKLASLRNKDNNDDYSILNDSHGHPDLVPYDQLTDEQKAYDRHRSTETLKFLLASGYELKRRTNTGRKGVRFVIMLMRIIIARLSQVKLTLADASNESCTLPFQTPVKQTWTRDIFTLLTSKPTTDEPDRNDNISVRKRVKGTKSERDTYYKQVRFIILPFLEVVLIEFRDHFLPNTRYTLGHIPEREHHLLELLIQEIISCASKISTPTIVSGALSAAVQNMFISNECHSIKDKQTTQQTGNNSAALLSQASSEHTTMTTHSKEEQRMESILSGRPPVVDKLLAVSAELLSWLIQQRTRAAQVAATECNNDDSLCHDDCDIIRVGNICASVILPTLRVFFEAHSGASCLQSSEADSYMSAILQACCNQQVQSVFTRIDLSACIASRHVLFHISRCIPNPFAALQAFDFEPGLPSSFEQALQVIENILTKNTHDIIHENTLHRLVPMLCGHLTRLKSSTGSTANVGMLEQTAALLISLHFFLAANSLTRPLSKQLMLFIQTVLSVGSYNLSLQLFHPVLRSAKAIIARAPEYEALPHATSDSELREHVAHFMAVLPQMAAYLQARICNFSKED